MDTSPENNKLNVSSTNKFSKQLCVSDNQCSTIDFFKAKKELKIKRAIEALQKKASNRGW